MFSVRPHTFLLASLILTLPALAAGARADQRDTIMNALQEEMARSSKKLKLEDHATPYYIGYRLVDRHSATAEARFGALVQKDRRHQRSVAVDVRVGDYKFDSSPNPEDVDFIGPEGFRPSSMAPIDDDPAALRATLWLLTDGAYKAALSTHLRKKANRVIKVQKKHVDSFSKEPKVEFRDAKKTYEVDLDAWAATAREVSAVFRNEHGFLDGTVRISADHDRVYLVNSEGTRMLREQVIYSFAINAVGRAEDGQLLEQGRTLYGRVYGDMPDKAELLKVARAAVTDLVALSKAPIAEPFTGPAILEPEATGVFFHEAVGHRLEGERQKDENEGQTFTGQVGQRILPDFITVRDDPTVPVWSGLALNGHYAFDDEGVAARNVTLVKDGVLKTFLTSRSPIEDVNRSNGHGRAQGIHRPMARMGNLIVEGKTPVKRARLKELLLEEVKKAGKPYGLIIRDITGGSTNTSNYGYQAFKGTPRMVYKVDAETGAETLVRGVEMVGTPLTAVSKIVATSEETGVFNGYCGAESGYGPVSTVAPATRFREIEPQRSQRLE